jgi:membrane protease YdiL (CAAX protease family)
VSRRQWIAVVALPVLAVSMLGVFRLLGWLLGPEVGWYVGFWVYWPVWCVLFPWWMLGWRRIRELFRRRRLGAVGWALTLGPPAIALIGALGVEHEQRGAWAVLAWVFMALANGTFEELLWRGVYLSLFPGKLGWGLTWPTVWFALWHFGPGGLHPGVGTLVAGAAVLGALMGWLAMRTGSIRYCVLAHTLCGLFWGLV